MNLIGCKFIDRNGKILTISSEEDGIVRMEENGSKVDVRVLNDAKYYTPYNLKINENINMTKSKYTGELNPEDFFKQTNFGNALEPLLGKNTLDFNEADTQNTSNEYFDDGLALKPYDPQLERERVAAKYGNGTQYQPDNRNNVFSPNFNVEGDSPFVKVNDDIQVVPDRIPIPAKLIEYQQHQRANNYVNVNDDYDYVNGDNKQLSNAPHLMQALGRQPIVDPVIEMFKKVKKNTDFKFVIEIEEKIPKLPFIEMMEESYEVSIIDYLADDFVKSLLSDPSVLKTKIADEIRRLINNNVDNGETNEKKISLKTEIKTEIKEEQIV
jgi:hypothetical protein